MKTNYSILELERIEQVLLKKHQDAYKNLMRVEEKFKNDFFKIIEHQILWKTNMNRYIELFKKDRDNDPAFKAATLHLSLLEAALKSISKYWDDAVEEFIESFNK